jgi:CheY-like chemotaxis protein/Tfp pilus assembly protein PilZ
MEKIKKGKREDELTKQIVLVIDGKPIRKFYTSIFLQRLSYHVITAKTAEDGLAYLNLTVPLVIIVNIDLPDMSGVDLLKRVKKNRRTRGVPVIIYTSNNDPNIQMACEQSACSAYLRHPATLEELYTAVQKATKKPRRFVRLDTFLDVVVGNGKPSAGPETKDYIAAISELGMFVSTNDPFTFGSVHPFTFHLPNAPGWVFNIEGQVVYHQSHWNRKQPGIGVKFLNIGAEERELIKDFIREKLMEGIAVV